jgi:hypothetical protein
VAFQNAYATSDMGAAIMILRAISRNGVFGICQTLVLNKVGAVALELERTFGPYATQSDPCFSLTVIPCPEIAA